MFYLILTMHGEGEQRILKRRDPTTPQSVERKRLTWFLKLSAKSSLPRLSYNGNVGKECQKYSMKMWISKVKIL